MSNANVFVVILDGKHVHPASTPPAVFKTRDAAGRYVATFVLEDIENGRLEDIEDRLKQFIAREDWDGMIDEISEYWLEHGGCDLYYVHECPVE